MTRRSGARARSTASGPTRAEAEAPPTIANLGPGFDVLGLALNLPGDRAVARRRAEPGLVFQLRTRHEGVPADPARNVAAHVVRLLWEEVRPGFGVDLTLHKLLPIGSGLGSSAASGVAALVAANALLPRPLPRATLLPFAIEGERLASGSPHADNVAPSLLGGVQLVLGSDPIELVPLPFVNRPWWIVVHPRVVVETREARRRLPGTIALSTAARQWGAVGALVAALGQGNARAIGRALVDRVAEPVRSPLIPGFDAVRAAALEAGACGMSISGSGPSVFAVAATAAEARSAARAMVRAFRRVGEVSATAFVTRIHRHGARVTR